jgi:hypothetical protein
MGRALRSVSGTFDTNILADAEGINELDGRRAAFVWKAAPREELPIRPVPRSDARRGGDRARNGGGRGVNGQA